MIRLRLEALLVLLVATFAAGLAVPLALSLVPCPLFLSVVTSDGATHKIRVEPGATAATVGYDLLELETAAQNPWCMGPDDDVMCSTDGGAQ